MHGEAALRPDDGTRASILVLTLGALVPWWFSFEIQAGYTMATGELAYVALISREPLAACEVFGRHLGLPRNDLAFAGETLPAFTVGRAALVVCPPEHALVEGDANPGVHHIALAVDNLQGAADRLNASGIAVAGSGAGLAGRAMRRASHAATVGVRIVLTEPLALVEHSGGPIERIDHLGVASTDVGEDERVFSRTLGFEVESRQTDMEVVMAVESFTSDKYGVVYHNRKPEPVGGLRVCFITIGDCELEFLANFNPQQGAEVRHGEPGTTRQDQGAITRFVQSRGRGLHHVALKSPDINATLARLASAGLPMIDKVGRPGSRRALIGFPHPKALGGILMHFVQR
jgi:catechol 2,3-dioxygenase-like lactoylglutathione lyase family enzyme